MNVEVPSFTDICQPVIIKHQADLFEAAYIIVNKLGLAGLTNPQVYPRLK